MLLEYFDCVSWETVPYDSYIKQYLKQIKNKGIYSLESI